MAQDRSRRSQFCDASSIPFLPTCIPLSPSLGTYTDFVGLQFLVIGPPPENTSISQSFDSGLMTGIGSFAIDPTASGAVSGLIVVTYDLYSVGLDGATATSTNAAASFDDVIRANDGGYLGQASKF